MSMIKKIWNLLGSVQIVVPLLIVITLVSLVGVVVPQGPVPPDFHLRGLRAAIIVHLGLNQVFSSWWFYSLLGLLSVNVVACSASHQLKSARKTLVPHFLKNKLDSSHLKCSTEFKTDKSQNHVVSVISSYFKTRLFFTASQKTDQTVQIATRSFFFKEIGSLLFHVSILFFFAGGIASSMQGFSVVKEFRKGEIRTFAEWPFMIRCDWFKLEKNEEGAISDYKSKLSVLGQDSSVLFTKIIEVNHPLSYKGLSFYQNSYGEQFDAIEDATLHISGDGIEGHVKELPVAFNTPVAILGKDTVTVIVSRFVCDFVIDASTKEIGTRSDRPNNPAVKVMLLKGKDTLFNNWVFAKYPDIHQDGQKGYKVAFIDYTPQFYTGIKVSKSPGNVFIWLGFALMTIGILLVFYFPHRNFWFFVEQTGDNSSHIIAGGSSSRALSAFQEEFKHTCSALQSHIKKGQ
jgi:cytochrome c biogenesis protein